MQPRNARYLLGISLFTLVHSSHGTLVIGGFNGTRVGPGSINDGFLTEEFRDLISTAFPGVTFVGTDSLSAGFLSSIDVLVTGAPLIDGVTSLSPLEQENLLNFVKSGGGALIFSDNDGHAGRPASDDAAETFLDPFGIDATGEIGGAPMLSVGHVNHPVIKGPFGSVETIGTYFSGWFDGYGAYAEVLAQYDTGEAAVLTIDPGKLSPQSGGVVFIGDANLFVDSAEGGHIAVADNKKFLTNSIAYVIPEPSVIPIGLAGLAILASRRRRWR